MFFICTWPAKLCLEFTKPNSFDINKRELRYTIKGASILKYIKIKQRFSTYLLKIAFVELYIKTLKCNFLMNNRRIVIVNVVKIIQKLQA